MSINVWLHSMENSPVIENLCPKIPTYSYSKCMFGALVDYFDSTLDYLKNRTFTRSNQTRTTEVDCRLSEDFLTCMCLFLCVISHLKLEVVMFTEEQLEDELSAVIISDKDALYLDEIDLSSVRWSLDAADLLSVLISCFFAWRSSRLASPYSEYALLPWLAVTLRGLMARQATSALAVAYVFAVAEESVRPIFSTAMALLFLVEVRLWMDVARLVVSRWRRRELAAVVKEVSTQMRVEEAREVETREVEIPNMQSVEVQNYLY